MMMMRWRVSNSMNLVRYFFYYLFASVRRRMRQMNLLFRCYVQLIILFYVAFARAIYCLAIIKYLSMSKNH